MKLDHEDPTALKIRRDTAIAALPMSLRQLHQEEKARDDEVTFFKAALEAQKTKFEAQLAEQSLQIHQQELDLRSEQLS